MNASEGPRNPLAYKNEQFIETAMKFEDGRSGSVSATLAIVDVPVTAVMEKAA